MSNPKYYTTLIMFGKDVFVLRTANKPKRRIMELATMIVPELEDRVALFPKDRFGIFQPDTWEVLSDEEAEARVAKFAQSCGVRF